MPEHDHDPLDALRAPIIPLAPDPAFAAALRGRLAQALATESREEENAMSRTEVTGEVLLREGFSRNGTKPGDVSYISQRVLDLDLARAFYGRVLGWRFAPGRLDAAGGQVDDVIPQIGLWSGPGAGGGAVLAFRVDDLEEAVATVRAQGGTATDPRREPYGLVSDCTDDQGLDFSLHQLPAPGAEAPENGARHGDVSHITLEVPDGAAARDFYGPLLGWRFNPGGRPDAWQVEGPRPMIGVAGGASEPSEPTVVLSYQVDDIAEAVRQVRALGGSSTDPAERPYGLEASCSDNQGTRFYLHEFPAE